MTDNIDVVVKESGSSQVVTSFDNVAAAAQRAHTSVSALQKLFGNVGRSTAAANRVTALGTAAQGATGHVNNLNTAMTSLNNTRVTANLNSANQALNNTGTASRTAATGVRDLLAAFISFAAIKHVVGTLIEAQVAMQQIHFGLLAATGSAEKAAVQMEYLRGNANKLGLDLQTSAQEYTRLAASADAMNVSMEDQQKLYTSLSQASTVLHLDAQKVQFATLALTQMFSKGKIQAEELRRQLGEAIPGVVPRFMKAVQEVTKGTDLAKYSFEDLMKRGLLNTKQFLPQLVSALEETGRGWEEASQGLNAEINRLKTAWFELKVEVTEGLFTDVLIGAVRFLSQNLKELTGVVIALGVAITVALAPAAIIRFTGYVKALGVAVWAAAGPWGLLAGAIVGVIAYLVTMKDAITLSTGSLATLADFVSVIWNDIKGLAEQLATNFKMIGAAIVGILPMVSPVFVALAALFDNYTLAAFDAFDDIAKSNDSTWVKVLKGTARTIDAIVGMLLGLASVAQEVFFEMTKLVIQGFMRSADAMKALFTGDFDKFKELASQNISEISGVFGKLGDAAGRAFDRGFGFVYENGLEQYVNKTQKEAERLALFKGVIGSSSTGTPAEADQDAAKKSGDKGKAAKELEKLKDALSRLLGQVDPTQAALKKLADAQEILNKATAKGLISKERAVEVMSLLREKYKDALQPVEALNEKYDRELTTLRAITPEQKALAISQDIMNKARKDGYDASMQAALGEAAYRRELEKTQAQLIASAESQVYQNSAGQQARGASAQVQGLNNQKAAGNIGAGQHAVGMRQAFGIDPSTMDQYTAQQEIYSAHLQAMQDLRMEYNTLAAETDGEAQANYIASAQATSQIINDLELARAQNTLSLMSGVFGQAAQLMGSHNKKLFKIGQSAAIAQAVVQTASAVLKAGADWGYPWAIPFQAIAIALGATQISQIRSQQPPSFRTGGSMVVGGSGGIDSQLVQFNASPGETVSINTPSQARALEQAAKQNDDSARQSKPINMNLTVVQTGKPDNKTPLQNAREMRRGAGRLMRTSKAF